MCIWERGHWGQLSFINVGKRLAVSKGFPCPAHPSLAPMGENFVVWEHKWGHDTSWICKSFLFLWHLLLHLLQRRGCILFFKLCVTTAQQKAQGKGGATTAQGVLEPRFCPPAARRSFCLFVGDVAFPHQSLGLYFWWGQVRGVYNSLNYYLTLLWSVEQALFGMSSLLQTLKKKKEKKILTNDIKTLKYRVLS